MAKKSGQYIMPHRHSWYNSFIFLYWQQGDQGRTLFIKIVYWLTVWKTNINVLIPQRQTYNEYQQDRHQFDLVTLNILYGASDMYDTFYATTICAIWTMISMDGGFDNSNWPFHDSRCHTSGNRNVTCPLTDTVTFTIYPFFLKLYNSMILVPL